MIYPDSFEDKIGFSTIRELIKSQCISDMGKLQVEQMTYHTEEEVILDLLEKTDEFRSVLLFEDSFPAQDYFNMEHIYASIHIEGSFIEIEDLAKLRCVIQAIIQAVVYFRIRHEEGKFPKLWSLCEPIILEKTLLESINLILDSKGNIRDNASDRLAQIKRDIRKISGEADRKIRKLLQLAKQDGFVKEDAEMTIRNGRLCIPVAAAYKRKLQGFIHDESATGQTVFIEPTEVFDANNELRDLLNAEKREIIRILTEITDEIRPSLPNLLLGQEFLGLIDFIRAKAKFAITCRAIKPHLFSKPLINWQQAIHPLLFLNFKESGKIVQPLDIELNEKGRILIISGPNAGGKSVCLKTVGLLQYMLQTGMLVPMKETSDMGIFSDFFIDIGDEQSIDNDLSTYSSHLTNLHMMIQNLNASSLFLIDEFGSGTEPTLGGAMAEAILEAIYQTDCYGIITTHYGNLKMFPDRFPEAINGAMLYDTRAMKPLFMLKIGKPGSSFTYEIARLIGLPEDIIHSATQKSGTAQIDYERKLEEIENEKIEIETRLRLVQAADEQLATMIADYQYKFNELDKQRKEILSKAKNQATTIIDNANKIIEKTIREIKESKADGVKTKVAREEIKVLKKELEKPIDSIEKEPEIQTLIPKKRKINKVVKPEKPESTEIRIGDFVFIENIQTVGEVKELRGDEVVVSFNSISFKTTLNKVEKISKKEARGTIRREGTKWDGSTLSDTLNKKVANFKSTIDLRGKRAEEALNELDLYLDEAVLLSVHEIKILHGKGNGILRRVIRDFLSKRKEVLSFNDERIEMGGDGITVVAL